MRDLFWPMLDGWDVVDRAELNHEAAEELNAIRNLNVRASATAVLDAVTAIVTYEERRRQIADARASTYLLVAAALVPLLTYLETAIWDGKQGSAPQWVTLPILVLGVLNLMGAGWWSFRTIQTQSFVTLDASDIVELVNGCRNFEASLAIKRLEMSRRNRALVNEKISYMGMSHRFMVRTFCLFAILILVEALSGLCTTLKALPGAGPW